MDWHQIAGIVAVVAGLLALRLVIQMVARRHGTAAGPGGGLPHKLRFLLPPLLTGGPMFLALTGAAGAVSDPAAPAWLFFAALGGGVALVFGLLLLLAFVLQQQRIIEALQERLQQSGEPSTRP